MAVDKINADIQSLSPEAIIELFILDYNNLHGGGANEAYIMRFHAGTNELRQNITWGGKEYIAMPIEAEGFDMSTQGTLPRPKIRLANPNGAFSAQLANSDDLVGSKICRNAYAGCMR
jgi:lambda family phage minor tail protein L